jgi:hypothetical protein
MKIEFDMTTKLPGQPMQRDPYEKDEQVTPDFMDMDMDMDMDMMNMDQNKYKNGEEMEMEQFEIGNPINNYNEIDLAKRDQYLLKIEDEIQLRRRFLLEKQKKLEKLSRQNHFLETIKDDYENYHNYIVEQKEGQIRAMNSIKQYVEDLIVSGKLTDQDIRQAKDDQREITSEVKKIREKINEIISF